jgi:hypothetical protein
VAAPRRSYPSAAITLRTTIPINANVPSANKANRTGMKFTSAWYKLCATRKPT